MNRTQKGAWVNMGSCLMCLVVYGYIAVNFVISGKIPETFIEKFWPVGLILTFFVATYFFLKKKQSLLEPESDERDKLIQKNAVIASFVSAWIFLAAASVIPQIIVGQDGLIPAWSLPLINILIPLLAMIVFSLAVLIQYGWGGKDGK